MAFHLFGGRNDGEQRSENADLKTATWRAIAFSIAVASTGSWVSTGRAAAVTWDSSGTSPTVVVDGTGSWDTVSALWSNPGVSTSADTTWKNAANDMAIFGGNNGAAGTVTIAEAGITAGGVVFNAAGSGSYTIAAAAGDNLTLAGTSPTINAAVSGTISAPIALNGNLTVTDGGLAVTTALGGIVSDGANGASSVTMNGAGSLTLINGNTYTGGTIINSGEVFLAGRTSAGTGPITLNGGTMSIAAASGGPVANALNIPAGASPTITGIGTEEVGGTVTGTGTLNLNFTAGQFNITSRTEFATFTGWIMLNASTSNATTTTIRVSQGNKSGSFGGGIDLGTSTGAFNTKVGGTYTIGAIAGGALTTLQGASTASDPTTYSIGSLGLSTTFNGIIEDGIATGTPTSLTITGGTLALTNTNIYTGNTTLSGGTLSVGAESNLGPASLIFNGGTLQVTGTTYNVLTRAMTWSATVGSGFDINNAANVFTVNTALSGGGLTKLGAGTLVLSQNYTTTLPTVVSGGTLQLGGAGNTVAGVAGAGKLVASSGTKGAPGLIADGIQAGGLTVNGAAQVRSNGASTGTSLVGSLVLAGATDAWIGSLDINNNKLIVESTAGGKAGAISTLQNEVRFGLTQSAGLASSGMAANMGLAVIDNGALGSPLTTFGGLAVDGNSILVSAELLGDTNADGHVDLTDLSVVLNNFGTATNAWTSGNFDGGTTIDLTDLSDVLNNFGLTNANASVIAGGAASAVPEPGCLAVLGLGAVGLMGRRRGGIRGRPQARRERRRFVCGASW